MEPVLQESLNQGNLYLTLNLQLDAAKAKFDAACVVSHAGGVFVSSPELIMWLERLTIVSAVVIDSQKRPIKVDVKELKQLLETAYHNAVYNYYGEYVQLMRKRNVGKILKIEEPT